MLFKYKAIDNTGVEREGTIEAINNEVAINSLQRRGLVISAISSAEKSESVFKKQFTFSFFERVSNKDIVILSRQIAILFEAQVSALKVFRLLASEAENPILRKVLTRVSDDIQGGSSISKAMERNPKVFSEFYVNMVKSGEESGKLDKTFMYLADYLERTFEVTSKARNALIYPAFVIAVFIAVMILMFTAVIPKISAILVETGLELPIYTKIIIAISNFLVSYWIFIIIAVLVGVFLLTRYVRTPAGRMSFDEFKLSIPYVGVLYKKLYLSRIADNMNTMLVSGITMIKTFEITASVVGNLVYKRILQDVLESIKGGSTVSQALAKYQEIPGVMVQMIKVGEETGELGTIMKTMSRYYEREVVNSVDTLVSLIEPVMIVVLGLGVGILLAAVLVPIYNIAGSF